MATPAPSGGTSASRPGPLRRYKRLLWGFFFGYASLLSVAGSIGIIDTLMKGGPLQPRLAEEVVPLDPFAPATAELRLCLDDLTGLHHQIRERVTALGIAVRTLDPAKLDSWRRWSATWRASMDFLSARCHLRDPPGGAHPALLAMADAYAILRAAGDRYLEGIESLAASEAVSLAGAADALRAARKAVSATASGESAPSPATAVP